MDALLAETSIGITELKKNPSAVIREAGAQTIVVLHHNKPSAYLVPASTYEALMDVLDDLQLIPVVQQRISSWQADPDQVIEVSRSELEISLVVRLLHQPKHARQQNRCLAPFEPWAAHPVHTVCSCCPRPRESMILASRTCVHRRWLYIDKVPVMPLWLLVYREIVVRYRGYTQFLPTKYLAALTLKGAFAAIHNDWRQRFTFSNTLPFGDGIWPIRGKGGTGFDFNCLQTLLGLIQ